ncbi:MAG: phage virion morphogenesis protein [Burkholderiaceae bacterium]|jgi:phage virion morphogenesis protein|nr:phage virion morphogenesis protein [Burkholderiaceae bacterium]
MNELINIRLNDTALKRAIHGLQRRLRDMRPVMRAIAQTLEAKTERNFASQGRPRWKALKNPSERRKGGVILQDSGQLAASITTRYSDTQAIIGTNKVYARIHQFGGKTRAHPIKPKRKKVLAFGGKFARSVNHPGSNIPARPFLPVTADGRLQRETSEAIMETTLHHLKKVTGV